MKIRVKNRSETVVFKSVEEIVDSEIEVDTAEFCLYKTIETKLDQMAFQILKEKAKNEKYKLMLEGIQIVLSLKVENKEELKKEMKKLVEYIDEMIDQIGLDTGIQRQIRLKACVLGNLINGELRVQMV